jgi:hypothetical protein
MWIAREPRTGGPRFAVVRWIRADGGQDFASFASDKQPARLFDGDRIAESYPDERGSFSPVRYQEGLLGRSPKRYSTDRQRSVGVKKSFGNAPGNVSVTARLGSS